MLSYSFWNNKGGVGKSFLCFSAACEYAARNKEINVVVIDMCPQANTSEMLLGGYKNSKKGMDDLLRSGIDRCSVGAYFERRLNSPFFQIPDASKFSIKVNKYNKHIEDNLHLVCGDNLVEILSDGITQVSQLSVPTDSWKKVINWIRDLQKSIIDSTDRECVFFIDCNPSFSIYTQQAIAASDYLIVPFTADDSSRRGIENVAALLYGQGDDYLTSFSKLSFYKKARDEGVSIPKLHTFVANRITVFGKAPSKAYKMAKEAIQETVARLSERHRTLFANPSEKIEDRFIDFPDYHTTSVVVSFDGMPLGKIKSGPRKLIGENVSINENTMSGYRIALNDFVDRL